MEKIISVEPGYSDSTSPISEAPDITNWFSSYVYESFPFTSLANETETEVEPMKQISDRNLYESLPSEPPDIGNWFSSYVYESPMLDTHDGLELSVSRDSECIKETETEIERNNVCPRLFEQEHVSSAKVTDFSQSQSLLSEPPDVRNWFSSYEYQSPQLSGIHELGLSNFEKDELIIDESDTEEETSSHIFRKTKSRQETIATGMLESNDCNENIAADAAKDPDQGMKKKSSLGLFKALTKEVEQESSFKQEPLLCEPIQEPSFSLGISQYNPTPQSPSKNEASLHELRPKHIQETISVNFSRQKSPIRAVLKDSIDRESDDKENVNQKSIETGFVTTKNARFRESRDRCSIKKPNRGVLAECSSRKESKEKDEERERKKRRVLGEMSNQQLPRAEEIAGKWLCPQKNKGNLAPPLKQLRLDAWIHKV